MTQKPSMLQQISTATFRTPELDKHVDDFSLEALWEKSYLCPCRDKATRQPNQTCKICHGRGIAYLPPEPLKIIIQSQEKGSSNIDIGLMDAGTAIGTPERDTQIAFRDRLTVKEATVPQSFILDASQRRIDHGFYMTYDVKSIDFATSMSGELIEGRDYTVDLTNNLFFPAAHLLGKNVSINIQTTLRYLVADLLKEHRYGRNQQGQRVKLPQKLLLKREDIFIDKEAFELGVDNEEVSQEIDAKRKPNYDGLNGFFRKKD
ncbi:virion structural protein [Bacillus phage TsarBomba]|uniref:Uncharacterized protein n=1 Tax=Bacillus phage TsarBomba TaxID=1690456 RepID=A0A0K2D0I3_9CAUD|nr:virion structural protein [Bacillus phage TsarBomba]ALA13177.1 hypothetical protein TSARBOMBA_81 [Bacillus phage TsarBomba]